MYMYVIRNEELCKVDVTIKSDLESVMHVNWRLLTLAMVWANKGFCIHMRNSPIQLRL